ncbi:MAG TPA: ABC transporter permease [Dehalococcoidia bacterium]|nr:ABC transporter permease [Dehalococcoidia bacterium]
MNASAVKGKSNVTQMLVTILEKIADLFKIPLRTNSGRIGLAILAVYSIAVIFGPWLTPYIPTEYDLDHRFESPSLNHLFGTDHNGRDVLSRVIAGARSIVFISVIGTALGIFLGTMIGITSGYLGGWFDQIAMRAMDFLLSFPSLLLALLLITIGLQRTALDESWLITAVIGIAFTPNNSRVIRSAALTIKPLEFVENARLRGEPLYHIVLKEILPNIIPVIGVEASLRLSFALLLTASLGFLGLGVQPPQPDWGLMVNESRSHLALAPWASLAPAFAMGTLVIGVNLFADGIRQSLQLPEDRGQK